MKYLNVSDGARIAFEVTGSTNPDAPKAALVHSLAMDHTFWNPVAERLAPHASVLTIDARGHGESGKPAGPYTAPRMAQDLLEVVDALGWSKVVVAGASMGGCVALQFAASHADRTSGLGLIDTTAWYGATAPKDWATRAERARAEGLQVLIDFQKTRWFGDAFREAHADVVDRCIDIFLRNDVAAFGATCHMLGNFDGRSLLAGIGAPTAVVVGEEDYAAPVAMAEVMHEGIAGSTLTVIPAARHLTPLETPDVVARILSDLLVPGQPRG